MKLTSSIAMCTYNGERFLQQQLDSLANQTVLPDELIVSDDGSTDRTMEILHNFATSAPFSVQIFQNSQNLGYIKNFEQATRNCHKDIIFFSDQDDIWKPEKIETVLETFQNQPDVGLLLHWYEPIDADGNKLNLGDIYTPDWTGITAPEHKSAVPFLDNFASSWYGCMMAFRNQWSDLRYPFIINHDMCILNLYAVLTETIYLEAPLIEHRLHNWNTVDRRLSTDKRHKQWTQWGVWRFIPKLCHSIKKRLGLEIPGHVRNINQIRQMIVERLEGVPNLAHPEYLKCYKNITNMKGVLLRKIPPFKGNWTFYLDTPTDKKTDSQNIQ